MNLTIDFETRSRVDLKTRGVWVYAEDESTDVQCMAVMVDDQPAQLWAPDRYRALVNPPLLGHAEIQQLLVAADWITAYNVEFERAIWQKIMRERYDWPEVPVTKLRCLAARASMCGFPRSLDGCLSALGSAVQKDKAGYRVMLRMCRPQKDGGWCEDAESVRALCAYCLQDVRAERQLEKALPQLSDTELRIWQMDQEINERGIAVDTEACQAMIAALDAHSAVLLAEFAALTGGRVQSPRQVAATLEHLEEEEGASLEDLAKSSVTDALAGDLTPNARRILEIRQSLARSSVSKYQAAVARASSDSRLRSTALYHGAHSGRWAGKGVQLQNLPRPVYHDGELVLQAAALGGAPLVADLWGDVTKAASTAVRSVFTASPGKTLVAADFTAIEGRILAWLAGEEEILKAYRTGQDVYRITASWIFGVAPGEVTADQRLVGKVAELALGYQGAVGAFSTMARNYDLELPEDRVLEIVRTWRAKRAATVEYWATIEKAAMTALEKPGVKVVVGQRVAFKKHGRWLYCQLPSGRWLRYYHPEIGVNDRDRNAIFYWGVDAMTRKWTRLSTYGGKLVENIDQATARDALAEAMLRVNPRWPIVLHVHDEIVSETDNTPGLLAAYETEVVTPPAWATGLPVSAKGWAGKRYRKD